MTDVINIYCDESCHLERDHQKAMVLGAVWCPASNRAAVGRKIKALKQRHVIAPGIEIKWTKVSPARLDFYLALIDLFFDEPLFHFRAVVVPNKQLLEHERFDQTHDEFYYKMWYLLLTHLIDSDHQFRVLLDLKDTQGRAKVAKLHEILCNAHYDFDHQIIKQIQLVRSHDVPLLQMVDILIGALSYLHRGVETSAAKAAIVGRIRERSRHSLLRSTLPREEKFNLLVWRAQVDR
jgi:hypothetical protein